MVETAEAPRKGKKEAKRETDEDHVARIKKHLEGHGEYYKKHGLHYDTLMKDHYSTPEKQVTIGEKVEDISHVLEEVLRKYLDVVGIGGENASDYLIDLSLTANDIREMYFGRLGTIFDADEANRIKEQLRTRLRAKLKQVIDGRAGQIQEPKKLQDIARYIVQKAGLEHLFPPEEIPDNVKDQGTYQKIVTPAYETLVGKLEAAGKRIKKKEEKGDAGES